MLICLNAAVSQLIATADLTAIHDHASTQLLRRFNGDIMVMSVRTDGPAKRSGIYAGDILSAVGQTSVQGMEVEHVMNLLYGPPLLSVIRACAHVQSVWPVRMVSVHEDRELMRRRLP